MTDTTALIEALERAEGPSRELDAQIEVATFFKGNCGYQVSRGCFYATDKRVIPVHEAPAYTASIDAALTLVPEGEAEAALCSAMMLCARAIGAVTVKDLPRFICIAALRAKGSQS